MIDKATGLSEKQKAFCDYYIANGGNGTQAAKDAGYKGKSDGTYAVTANENLRKPKIKAYIAERMTEIESNRIASAEECMQILTSIARGEATDVDSKGNVIPVPCGARTKAAELMLRVHGSFNDKLSIKNEGPIVLAGDDLVPD